MLIDQIFPNNGIAESLSKLGVETDGKIITPWVGEDYAVSDIHGNTLGYLSTADHGGINFYDTNMNEIGWSMESAAGTSDLYGADNVQVGFSQENVFGGVNQFNADGQLESFSQTNVFEGTDIFSPDMELLQSTSFMGDPSASFDSFQADIPDIDLSFGATDFAEFGGLEDTLEITSFFDFLG